MNTSVQGVSAGNVDDREHHSLAYVAESGFVVVSSASIAEGVDRSQQGISCQR